MTFLCSKERAVLRIHPRATCGSRKRCYRITGALPSSLLPAAVHVPQRVTVLSASPRGTQTAASCPPHGPSLTAKRAQIQALLLYQRRHLSLVSFDASLTLPFLRGILG